MGSTVHKMLFQSSAGGPCYQRGLQMAKVISYPKEIAIAFNTVSNKRTAIPLFPIRTINL